MNTFDDLSPPNEEEDWEALDAEYQEFLQEAYGGKVPTLAEFKCDVALLRYECQQQPQYN